MSRLRSLLRTMRSRASVARDEGTARTADIVAELVPLTLGHIPVRIAIARDATDQYSEWIRNGLWTEPALHWALKITQPNWQVLDLGAHVGTFALTVAERCERVVAVEAMPDNFVLLVAGVAQSQASIVPVHAAVTARSGTTTMSDRSAWARVDPSGDVIVPALSVRDLCAAFGEGGFDLIKIDIEGSEPAVLPPLLDLVATRPDVAIIYESNQAVSDRSVQSLHATVAAAGFRQWYLDPRTLDAFEVDPSHAQYTLNCDILAVRGHFDLEVPGRRLTPDVLREHIRVELTSHPVTLHRSYAFCLAQQLTPLLGTEFVAEMNSHMPIHEGAQDEIDRFRRVLH